MKNKNVKFSLRTKMVCMMGGMAVGIFLLYILVNAIFLEKYYIDNKRKAIINTYMQMEQIVRKGDALTDTEMQDIERMCAKTGVTTLITSSSGDILFTYGNKELLKYRLNAAIFDQGTNNLYVDIIQKNKKYVLQKVNSMEAENDSGNLEMWGVFSNGDIFIIRMAVANIHDSVNIYNKFLFVVATIVMLISFIVASIISSRVIKPLLQLTKISEKMLDLNFEVRYTGTSHDEIDVLGNTMNELSDKLESTITQLKIANNELQNDIAKKEEVDEMRKEFISNVSHELKTPIALIQGYAEGLKENVNEDEESRDFYCDVITDEALKMNKMVKKLLTLNQLEFGNNQIQIERFDIYEVIKGVLSKLNLMIEQNNATVKLDNYESMYVYGDEFQIEEVITNYVTNALNHIDYERIITISIERKEDKIRVTVHNTGDNIPEKDLQNIWEKFFKVDKARTREYGGSGIGLSIVKAIMKSHNNDCGVVNTSDGVAFWLELDSK